MVLYFSFYNAEEMRRRGVQIRKEEEERKGKRETRN